MSVATLTPRIREALGVSSAYDAESIPAAIRRQLGRLLRDYNFPKSIRRQDSTLTLNVAAYPLPTGFKHPLLVRLFNAADVSYSEPLRRQSGPARPTFPHPSQYWIEGNNLSLDMPVSADFEGVTLQHFYQSMSVADNEAWLTEDFEDVIFTLTCYRYAGELKKPETQQVFAPLWAEDQRSLAIYVNELDFEGLEIYQREAQPRRLTSRYPVGGEY